MAESARRAAVLGRPVAHSLSPVLHRAAYAALGLHWQYEAIECGADDLAGVLADRVDWAGFSCTMPLKRAALELAQDSSDDARAVGAANTLRPLAGGGWRADNTDVTGLLAALGEVGERSRRPGPRPPGVTLLGAGGTAQAALVALARLGAPDCAVLVRNPARTGELRAAAARAGIRVAVSPLSGDAPELAAPLVISTLPAGAADPVAGWPWAPDQTVVDVVYAPWPTSLAAAAASGGATVVGGALMLLHQAAAQVELMTGSPAPLEAMRTALHGAGGAAGEAVGR